MTGPAPATDPAARRLVLAAGLRRHLARRLGAILDGDVDLAEAARRLGEHTADLATVYGLAFDDPGYPGTGLGVEHVTNGRRLVLRCAVRGRDGTPIATVFTTLIPGRVPQVSVAPPTQPVDRAEPPDGHGRGMPRT